MSINRIAYIRLIVMPPPALAGTQADLMESLRGKEIPQLFTVDLADAVFG